MKISIVVPIYNAEKYLDDCIMSVVNQTNNNWELILVNDGSTDNSREICDMYAQKYNSKIRIYHKENEGQFLTRQYGIKKCTGEYVGFLDADDLLREDYVERIYNVVTANRNIDVICFNFYEWSEKNSEIKEIIKEPYKIYDSKETRKEVLKQIVEGTLPGAMWSKVFRTDFINDIEINTEYVIHSRYGEDAYQSFNYIGVAEQIVFLNDALYYYRINPLGASQGFDTRELYYFNNKYVFDYIEKSLGDWGLIEQNNKELLIARNFNETVYYILNYYRHSSDTKRKCNIIKYDWSTYLLENDFDKIKENKYVRKSYIKVWNAFKNKRYLEIFFRENFIGW